jgi:deuterolysin
MGFSKLAVAALASTAMAACPLSVAIVDTVDHVATVAVTNTGSEAVTVFKGNTVLSTHNTQDVFATAEGKSTCTEAPPR